MKKSSKRNETYPNFVLVDKRIRYTLRETISQAIQKYKQMMYGQKEDFETPVIIDNQTGHFFIPLAEHPAHIRTIPIKASASKPLALTIQKKSRI